MKALKTILLVLTVLAFIVFSFFFLVGKGVENTFLNEDFYEKVFDDTELAKVLSDGASVLMSEEMREEVFGPEDESAEEIASKPASKTFDADWIEKNVPTFTRNMLAWLKGESDSEVFLELGDKKAQLQENIKVYMRELPRGELERTGLSPKEIDQVKAGNFANMDIDIPSEVTAEDVFATKGVESIEERRDRFQTNYERFRIWSYVALALFGGLFIFTAGVFSGSKWMGGLMLFAGLVVFAVPRVFSGLIFVVVSGKFEGSANAAVIEDVVSVVITEFTQPALIYGVIGLALLIAGIVGGRAFKRAKSSDDNNNPLSAKQVEESAEPQPFRTSSK